MDYGRTIELSLPHDQAVANVKEAFKEQGFGTLTEIEVRATLKDKIDRDIEPYVILGTCNRQLASRALNVEWELRLLLRANELKPVADEAAELIATPLRNWRRYEQA